MKRDQTIFLYLTKQFNKICPKSPLILFFNYFYPYLSNILAHQFKILEAWSQLLLVARNGQGLKGTCEGESRGRIFSSGILRSNNPIPSSTEHGFQRQRTVYLDRVVAAGARFAAIPWLSKDSLRWILEEIHGNRLNRCNHRSVWKLTVFVKLSCPFRKCLLPWATYELARPKIEDETVVCRCQVSCFAWVEMIVVHRSADTLHFADEVDRASIKGSLVIRISRDPMDRCVDSALIASFNEMGGLD